jgi:tryptophanyl-tRNA synthetase
MSKPVILTGLRANNDLHIGNYFGALLPLVDMAKNKSDDYQINLFVPDLHSFTTPIDHSTLQTQILHNVKLFAAAGLPLDNDNIHIYRQSYVPAHSELTWILDCFTGFGQLNRMTQFKDKSNKALAKVPALKDAQLVNAGDDADMLTRAGVNISVGLFNYPVLMAADILLYGAQYVPVGDDQSQHLEFTRYIAERMNNKFAERGLNFVVPEPVKKQHEFFNKEQGLRIRDLADPSRKMSKSEQSDKGVIFLGDSPDEAAKKVMSAATDSVGKVHYNLDKQPGISNLLQISALLSGESLDAVAAKHQGKQSYGDLKKEVADQVKEFLTDFQSKLANVDEAHLMYKLKGDEAKMNDAANKKLIEVQKAVGLR